MAGKPAKVIPAMISITNLATGKLHVPPDGMVAGPATFPQLFFDGVNYSAGKNWVGPIRKMSGMGGVNQERTYVYGTTPSLLYWKESLMYQVSGNFSISLSEGDWRISIQHGVEFVPVTENFTITGKEKSVSKKYLLKRWIDMPSKGWYSGDVHAHSALNTKSDIDYVRKLAQAEDVHILNMLEMGDRLATHFKAPGFGKKSRIIDGDICLAFGQEEPRSDYGHIIGLNIKSLARDTSAYNHYDKVFTKIHQSKTSLVGFAHFAYKGEGVTQGLAYYVPSGHVDFVELLQNTKINTEDYYDYLNMGFRFSASAGSDFPWGSTVGDGRTYVYTGQKFSPDKWFEGLKKGNSFVSNGPMLFLEAEGKMPGETIVKKRGDSLTIIVTAISNSVIGKIKKIELIDNDGIVETITDPGTDSVRMEKKYAVSRSRWMIAAVYCDNEALAHTSPIFISVNGQSWRSEEKLPVLIQKQLRILDEVKERENGKKIPDDGVLRRVEFARQFYLALVHNPPGATQ